jgi:uncharacterized membrane protein HdeD (DUF308 family)
MEATLSKNWWIFLIRGAAAILFGIAVILFPAIALNVLVLLIAAYLLVDGVFSVIYALQNRSRRRWWILLLEGFISVLAGIGAFLFPAITSLILLNIVAFWAILTGLMEIIYAIEMRKVIENEFWLGLSGVLSVLFGILLIAFPGTGLLSLLGLLAGFAIIFGIFMIIFAFRLRSRGDQTGTMTTA